MSPLRVVGAVYHDRITPAHIVSYGEGRHKMSAHSPQRCISQAPDSEFLCTMALFLPWASFQEDSVLKTFPMFSVKDFRELSVALFGTSACP